MIISLSYVVSKSTIANLPAFKKSGGGLHPKITGHFILHKLRKA
jgi:hypothetical protein